MAILTVNSGKCTLCGICVEVCPFKAMEVKGSTIEINESCKMCRLCIKKCPEGAVALIDEQRQKVSKEHWKGIMVYVEHLDGEIHPVTLELIGKAKELAAKVNYPVYCLFIGNGIMKKSEELLFYGVDKVFVYDEESLRYFKVDTYANAFEDCINKVKPSIVLVGGTSIGRSLAPKVSTRFRAGLTADCTVLDIKENTDLIQIRPAFGGNIMAQIVTPNSRPQFATVRYKVMDSAKRSAKIFGSIERCILDSSKLESKINVIRVVHKDKVPSITEAEVIVAGGRGLKEQKDLAMLEELAVLLGGQVAGTRSLVESGWIPYTKQIGLSGRTVKPRLIITCGISGAVQFTASMNSSDCIIAVNKDKNAPIFKVAHYGIVGDIYEVIPELIKKIKEEKVNAV